MNEQLPTAEVTLKDGRTLSATVEGLDAVLDGQAFAIVEIGGTLYAAPHEPLYSWEHLDPKSEAYEAKDFGRFASEVEAGEYGPPPGTTRDD